MYVTYDEDKARRAVRAAMRRYGMSLLKFAAYSDVTGEDLSVWLDGGPMDYQNTRRVCLAVGVLRLYGPPKAARVI